MADKPALCGQGGFRGMRGLRLRPGFQSSQWFGPDPAMASDGQAALSPFAVGSSGSIVFAGSGSCALSPFAIAGTGTERFTGSGSAAAAPFAMGASGAETFAGTGSAAASPFGAAGTGTERFSGSGSAAVQPVGVSGAGEYVPIVITRSAGRAMESHGVGRRRQR